MGNQNKERIIIFKLLWIFDQQVWRAVSLTRWIKSLDSDVTKEKSDNADASIQTSIVKIEK